MKRQISILIDIFLNIAHLRVNYVQFTIHSLDIWLLLAFTQIYVASVGYVKIGSDTSSVLMLLILLI